MQRDEQLHAGRIYPARDTKNGKFLYGAVNRFTPADTVRFFETLGVPLKTERGRRVFPESDKAAVLPPLWRKICLNAARNISAPR